MVPWLCCTDMSSSAAAAAPVGVQPPGTRTIVVRANQSMRQGAALTPAASLARGSDSAPPPPGAVGDGSACATPTGAAVDGSSCFGDSDVLDLTVRAAWKPPKVRFSHSAETDAQLVYLGQCRRATPLPLCAACSSPCASALSVGAPSLGWQLKSTRCS
jgi:hypothetical protein